MNNCKKIPQSRLEFMRVRIDNDLRELETYPMEHLDRIERKIVRVDIGRDKAFINFTERPKVGPYRGRELHVSPFFVFFVDPFLVHPDLSWGVSVQEAAHSESE